jgi:hypothetical protein
LNSAWSAIVRFLQPASLSLADAQEDARGNHAGGATSRQSRAGVRKPVALLSWDIPAPPALTANSGCQEHRTNNQRNTGPAEPEPRSPHTNIHLLERVSVDCPWRAWHNFDTSIV